MRVCNKCKEEKEIWEFYTHTKGHVLKRCKKCVLNYQKDYYYRVMRPITNKGAYMVKERRDGQPDNAA